MRRALLGLGAGVVFGVAGLFVLVVGRPDAFVVSRIVFEGAVRATPAQLRHLADVRNGTRWWEVDPARVSAAVARHPWVEQVTTERQLDGTLRVAVVERTPVALLAWGGQLLYVDDGGRPFLEADTRQLDLPLIIGIDDELEGRNFRIPRLAIRDALWLLDALDVGGLVPRREVSDVTFAWHRGFTVRTTGTQALGGPSELVFAFDDLPSQVARLGKLVEQGVQPRAGHHIDLGGRSVAVVRPLASGGATGDAATSNRGPSGESE